MTKNLGEFTFKIGPIWHIIFLLDKKPVKIPTHFQKYDFFRKIWVETNSRTLNQKRENIIVMEVQCSRANTLIHSLLKAKISQRYLYN